LHELPRNAQAHSGAIALGRKEGYENTVQMLGGNSRAVINDLQQDFILGVARGAQNDFRGGVSGQRLGGIADEIDQHLFDLAGIYTNARRIVIALCFECNAVCLRISGHQEAHPFQQRTDFDIREHRFGQFGKTAVGTDEIQQASASGVDRRHAAQHIVLLRWRQLAHDRRRRGFINHGLAYQSAQGDYGRDGVHDFMGQDAYQFLPGIGFLAVKFVADVLERNQLVALAQQFERRRIQQQLQIVVFPGYRQQRPFAVAQFLQNFRQPWVDTAERMPAVQEGQSEQPPGGPVHHPDVAALVEAAQGNADMLHDGFQILKICRLLQIQPSELLAEEAIRGLQLHENRTFVRHRNRGRIVMVRDEAQEGREFPGGPLNVMDEFDGAGRDQRKTQDGGRDPGGIQPAPDEDQAQRNQDQDANQDIGAKVTEAHSASFCDRVSCD
jgi:hypothetical protein